MQRREILMASGRANGPGNTHGTRDPSHNEITKRIRRAAKIIIIDDNPNDLIMLKRALEKRLGQKIEIPGDLEETTSLDDAKELVVKHSPDILITDKNFCPEDDAHFEALDFAKDNYPVTVILFSGTVKGSDRERKEPYAFDHVVEKTIGLEGFDEVAEIVEELLSEEKKLEEAEQIQRKAKVIVIDDELHVVKAVSRMLKNSKLLNVTDDIPATESFEQATELIEEHKPDVVICDKQIWTEEEGDHIRILNYLRENYPNTKTVLFSSAIDESDMDAGFDGFVRKPVAEEEEVIGMIKLVERLASESLDERETQTQEQKETRVLVIDNNQFMINSIVRNLGIMEGIDAPKVEVPTSFEEAMELIRTHEPDVVLMNRFSVEGIEQYFRLLDFIKYWYPDTKVILHSGSMRQSDRTRTEPFGFDEFVKKEGEIKKLMDAVERLAKRE